jgi:hypothetical protein
VDEGHVHGAARTRISTVASKLNVERRWLVSGTPTRTLLGLKFGSHGEDTDRGVSEVGEKPEVDEGDVGLPYPSRELSPMLVDEDAVRVRVWTEADREDLHRLHTMISMFLKDERFVAIPDLFNTHVMKALFSQDGPYPGGVQVLNQLMNSVMLRHRFLFICFDRKAYLLRTRRIEDIEKEVLLPPLYEETVVLDMDPLIRISYNALQAAIVVNAVDSERVDRASVSSMSVV